MKTKYTEEMHEFFKEPRGHWKDLFGRKEREIHLFMHCHMRDLDRNGEGLMLYRNAGKIERDKYGVPIEPMVNCTVGGMAQICFKSLRTHTQGCQGCQ
jgi:hypothetical protein